MSLKSKVSFLILLILLGGLLYSCSTSNISKTETVKFSGKVVRGEGKYLLPVPAGWFAADSLTLGSLTFLFAKDDGTASISFRRINIASNLNDLTLRRIFNYEKKVFLLDRKKFKVVKEHSITEKVNEEKAAFALFKDKNKYAHLTIFNHAGKYFESLLFCSKDVKQNIAVQSALIKKFEFLNK